MDPIYNVSLSLLPRLPSSPSLPMNFLSIPPDRFVSIPLLSIPPLFLPLPPLPSLSLSQNVGWKKKKTITYFINLSSSPELAWIGGAGLLLGLSPLPPPRVARYPPRKVVLRVAIASYGELEGGGSHGGGFTRGGGVNTGGGNDVPRGHRLGGREWCIGRPFLMMMGGDWVWW